MLPPFFIIKTCSLLVITGLRSTAGDCIFLKQTTLFCLCCHHEMDVTWWKQRRCSSDHYKRHIVTTFAYRYCVARPACILLCTDRPTLNARRHTTWQLLSLALHLSLCKAAVSLTCKVKSKHFRIHVWHSEKQTICKHLHYIHSYMCWLCTHTHTGKTGWNTLKM